MDFLKNCDVQRREIWAIFSRLALRERYKVARNISRTKHKLALWIKIRLRTKPKYFLCKKNSIPTIFLTLYAVAWPPPLFPVTLHKSVLLVQQGVEISRIAYKRGLFLQAINNSIHRAQCGRIRTKRSIDLILLHRSQLLILGLQNRWRAGKFVGYRKI